MRTQADELRDQQKLFNKHIAYIESKGIDHKTSLHKYLVSERDKAINKLNNIIAIW